MVVGGHCSVEGCKRQHMYNSLVCYMHKGEEEGAEPEPKPVEEEPQRSSTEEEAVTVNGDGPSPIFFIAGICIVVWFLKELLEGNTDFGNGNCGGGAELCLAPLAGVPALGRSSTGKFTEGKTSNTKQPGLVGILHCLHMDSSNGKKCRRMVMKRSGLCYQHQDSDAAVVYLKAIGMDSSGEVLRYNVDGVNKAGSSKDIDGLVEALGEAKKFWVVDLGFDETEFVQFTYDGDIDDDGKRDGVAVLEHWRGGEMISQNCRSDVHKLRATDRMRSILTGEDPVPPENPRCEELGLCEFDGSGRCVYCLTYTPDLDET
jgi:hypothetical protein